MSVPAAATRSCPECGTPVPVDEGFVTWCACGWNLAPRTRTNRPETALDGMLRRLARRLDEQLRRELESAGDLEPRVTPAKVLAYAVAGSVHLLTAASVAGAVLMAIRSSGNPLLLAAAVPVLAFAWLVRPRLGKAPDTGVLEPERAPELYALVAKIAQALETRSAGLIAVDDEVNASWSVVGLRRRRVLTLGLPLLAALTPQERVALTAHELAHGRNGDLRRGLFIGSAMDALEEIYSALLPGKSLLTYSSFGLLDRSARLLMWLLAQPVKWLLLLEFHLLLREMQRAEYLADSLAASVAGTDATVSLLEKFLLETTIGMSVRHAAHGKLETDAVFGAIGDQIANAPARERERVRRIAELEGARLGATHPPTAMRIRLLEERPPLPPKIFVEASAIDAELHVERTRVARVLVERYRAALYY